MKRVLSSSVDATSLQGGVNEIYAKVLCHNLRMLVQSIYELGIDPHFYAPTPPANDGGIQ
jgi:hypothetical protein